MIRVEKNPLNERFVLILGKHVNLVIGGIGCVHLVDKRPKSFEIFFVLHNKLFSYYTQLERKFTIGLHVFLAPARF